MGLSAPIIGVRCHYCSRWKAHADVIQFCGMVMCLNCHERHEKAMAVLAAGGVPPECAECHVTFEQLSQRAGGADVPMELHHRDGMYQWLCLACGESYLRQRRDLYPSTLSAGNI